MRHVYIYSHADGLGYTHYGEIAWRQQDIMRHADPVLRGMARQCALFYGRIASESDIPTDPNLSLTSASHTERQALTGRESARSTLHFRDRRYELLRIRVSPQKFYPQAPIWEFSAEDDSYLSEYYCQVSIEDGVRTVLTGPLLRRNATLAEHVHTALISEATDFDLLDDIGVGVADLMSACLRNTHTCFTKEDVLVRTLEKDDPDLLADLIESGILRLK